MDTDKIVENFEILQALPEGVHWLCSTWTVPGSDDPTGETPVEDPGKEKLDLFQSSEETEKRRKAFFDCLDIFIIESESATLLQKYIQQNLNRQLGCCDACIREYYRGKRPLIEKYLSESPEDEVNALFKEFDSYDLARINSRLQAAQTCLHSLPPEDRSIKQLTQHQIFSLFEALSCEAFLRDESHLEGCFDDVFRTIQTKKLLVVDDYLPAVAWFLFSPSEHRRAWAYHSWSKISRPPTRLDFDFAMRMPVLLALQKAIQPNIEPDFLEIFWLGMSIVVDHFDKDLIRHSLRALDVDICRVALEHLQSETKGLLELLKVVEILVQKIPDDFWDAMGAISPSTVLEQIFNNTEYVKLISLNPSDAPKHTSLQELLDWVEPFLDSIKPVNQLPACRTIIRQLLDRFQNEKLYIRSTRYICCKVGFSVLLKSLQYFLGQAMTRKIDDRAVISDLLEMVCQHHDLLLGSYETLCGNEDELATLKGIAMKIVRDALSLDSNGLLADYDALRKGRDIHWDISYAEALWKAVVRNLNDENLDLARSALTGIRGIGELGKFDAESLTAQAKKKTEQFNDTFQSATDRILEIFEAVSDFRPEVLEPLFRNSSTCYTLISGLVSPDSRTCQVAVNIIKTISRESGRREALAYFLKPRSFFSVTLETFSSCARNIARRHLFTPTPHMLKMSNDILDILCDPQHGMLRSGLLKPSQISAVKAFWESQWQLLTIIFYMTETWSILFRTNGQRSTKMLSEFCRDTMQFARKLFEQHSLFASATQRSPSSELLCQAAAVIETMVMWLRLRDEYLAGTLVNLLVKLLEQIIASKIPLHNVPLHYIELVSAREIKTVLTPQQRAELGRAIDRDVNVISDSGNITRRVGQSSATFLVPVGTNPKQMIEDDLSENGDALRAVAPTPASDKECRSLKLAVDRSRIRRSVPRVVGPLHYAANSYTSKQVTADSMRAFKEKREREMEAKKSRDAQELSRLKNHGLEAGDGSTLLGLGIKGKDHNMHVKSHMMLSSDSETDPEDDIMKALKLKQPISDNFRAYQNSKLESFKNAQQIPVKKTRQLRSSKDIRARLAPNLTILHAHILSWNFFGSSQFLPRSDKTDYSLVNDVFKHALEYQQTFEPLLLLEAWQAFQKVKEENTFSAFKVKIGSMQRVDNFTELVSTIPSSEFKGLGISEADVLLLSTAEDPTTDSTSPHCYARVSTIKRSKGSTELTYRVRIKNTLTGCLKPPANIYGVRILSITPFEREYGALLGLQYYDLCDEIVQAKPSPLLWYSDRQITPFMNNYKLNQAQAKAVRSAMDNDAFTLIQGPPGSGKTKTIIAIAGVLLTNVLRDRDVVIALPNSASTPPIPRKLLICAPSNAAVDELVMRLKEGVKTLDGKQCKISIVRLGRSDVVNSNVLDVTLEELVNAKLAGIDKKTEQGKNIHDIMKQHKAVSDEISQVRAQLRRDKADGKPLDNSLENRFVLLKRTQVSLGQQIDNARDRATVVARDAEIARRRAQQDILDHSHIICATLSGSGHEMFQHLNVEFETVIIDEAAQSIELSALIPLKYGCSKCILVGDPKQLPPTVLSKKAAQFQYEQSLFVRMQKNHPDDVHLLDTQYRMHPQISLFPSEAFYDGKLVDGPDMANIRTRPWHRSKLLSPFRFFDVKGQERTVQNSHSLVNIMEVNVALLLFSRLQKNYPTFDFAGKIGIITPYKSQLHQLRSSFAAKFGEDIFTKIEFNTTDAFQGRESDVIIFSCVRASLAGGIGFLNDIRRMNVGLTRAKCSLWVLGNSESLARGPYWQKLISDVKMRNLYTDCSLIEVFNNPLLPERSDDTIHDIVMDDAPSSRPTGAADPKKVAEPKSAASPKKIAEPKNSSKNASKKASQKHIPTSKLSPNLATFDAATASKTNVDGAVTRLSDGKFGLNEGLTCWTCGSTEHYAVDCDNVEARIAKFGVCSRCGDPMHRKKECTVERCLECGRFGHEASTCTSKEVLPQYVKKRILREEQCHRHFLSQCPTRRPSDNDHDPKVPKITVLHDKLELKSAGTNTQPNKSSNKRLAASLPLYPAKAQKTSKANADAHSEATRQGMPKNQSNADASRKRPRRHRERDIQGTRNRAEGPGKPEEPKDSKSLKRANVR